MAARRPATTATYQPDKQSLKPDCAKTFSLAAGGISSHTGCMDTSRMVAALEKSLDSLDRQLELADLRTALELAPSKLDSLRADGPLVRHVVWGRACKEP